MDVDPDADRLMVSLELPIDAAWAAGLVLAITRVAAFTVTSPITGRALPGPARLAFTVAIGASLAAPVPAVLDLGSLVGAAVANAIIGGTIGFVSGLIVHLFATAGGIVDFVSGLSVATVFDPVSGEQGAVFARMFHMAAVLLILVGGGMALIVGALATSVRVLPLGGGIAPSGILPETVVNLTTQVMRSGVELVLPVIGVLLMLELAFGLAARFSPQANVLLLGLPAKILTAITVVGSSWVLFPDAISDAQRTIGRATEAALRGLGA